MRPLCDATLALALFQDGPSSPWLQRNASGCNTKGALGLALLARSVSANHEP